MRINVSSRENRRPGARRPRAGGDGSALGSGAGAGSGTRSGDTAAASAAERAVERSLSQRRATVSAEVERLVAAAFALIRDTGELEPRVSEIVAAAGLSNQAFYRHFRSKRELLVAALDVGIHQLAGYLEHQMDKQPDPVAAIRAWIRGMLRQVLAPEAAAATRPFALARGRLADAYPEEVARSERQLTAPLRGAIEAAREAGALPHSHPEHDAESLYHLTMGWLQARLAEPGEELAASAERLEHFALAGLGLAREDEPAEKARDHGAVHGT